MHPLDPRAAAREDGRGEPLADWTDPGPRVSPPGRERVIMNFWLMDGPTDPAMKRREVVIRSLEFRPAPGKP